MKGNIFPLHFSSVSLPNHAWRSDQSLWHVRQALAASVLSDTGLVGDDDALASEEANVSVYCGALVIVVVISIAIVTVTVTTVVTATASCPC